MPFPSGEMNVDAWSAIEQANAANRAAVGRGPAPAEPQVVPGGWPGGLEPRGPRPASGLPSHLSQPSSTWFPSPGDESEPTPPAALSSPPVAAGGWDQGFYEGGTLNLDRRPATPPERQHQAIIYEPGGLHLAEGLNNANEDLFWKVACKTGTLALSPGPGQMDLDKPLELTPDLFDNIKAAFEEQAFPHVTVPETHDNLVLQNTGYVRRLEIVDPTDERLPDAIREAHADDDDGTKLLMAGVEFTEPEVRQRAENGSIPDTSIGVKFNYRNKRSGTTYPCAMEHLALTPVPWVDGLSAFHQGTYLSQRQPYDHATDFPYDGVYMDMKLAMRTSVHDEEWDGEKAKKAIEALNSGDEVSWNYGVRVLRIENDGSSEPAWLLWPGYDMDSDSRGPRLYTSLDKLMDACQTEVVAQHTREKERKARYDRMSPVGMYSVQEMQSEGWSLAEQHTKVKCPKCDTVNSAKNKTCTNCGHDLSDARKAKFAKLNASQGRGVPLSEDVEVGSLPGELSLATNPAINPGANMPQPRQKSAAQILATQQAEIERLNQELAQARGDLSLSQGTTSALSQQVHTDNVAKKISALEGKVPPSVLRNAQAIYLSDLSGTVGVPEGEGLQLSVPVTRRTTGTDGQAVETVEQTALNSPTAIVDFLLSAMPAVPYDEATRFAAIQAHMDAQAEEAGLALSGPDNSDEAKKALVEAHEREAHPERFKDNGKGERL